MTAPAKHLRRTDTLTKHFGVAHNFAGDKERIENAIYRQTRIHCDVTFDQGTAVITPLGEDKGDYVAFVVARFIAKEMGYEAKQGFQKTN